MGLNKKGHTTISYKAPNKGVFCISKHEASIDYSQLYFSNDCSSSLFIFIDKNIESDIERYIYFENEKSSQSIAPKIAINEDGFHTLHFNYSNNAAAKQISDILYNVSLLKQYYTHIFFVVDILERPELHILSKASRCTLFYGVQNSGATALRNYLQKHAIVSIDLLDATGFTAEKIAKEINKRVVTVRDDATLSIVFSICLVVATVVGLFFAQYHPIFMRSLQSFSEMQSDDADYIYEYEFQGTETVYRIARYIVSKEVSWVADSADILNYLQATIDRSTIYTDSIEKYKPREGTVVRFYPIDDSLSTPRHDSLADAYNFYTSIYGDSIAYLTDYWQKKKTRSHRKHPAIDIGTSFDAYIVAPIDGHAHVRTDPRGGNMITLFNDSFLITFAHCNKLLFFDNQDAYVGDVLATIGVSGNTTGPHAHIETAIKSPKGSIRYGRTRYKRIDPFEWYPLYKADQERKKNELIRKQMVRDSIVKDSVFQDSIQKAQSPEIDSNVRKSKMDQRMRKPRFNRR
ncbi:MAG: M23 family metallopeptidase [Fibrobacterales bacterium]